MGRARCGMQFHFAPAQAVVADWTRRFPNICDDMWPGWITDLAALAAQHGAQADATGLAFARNWVGLVRS
jgi:GMP synthase (glutamine-hydrolysing)